MNRQLVDRLGIAVIAIAAVQCRVTVGGRVVKTQKSAPGEVAACVS